MASSGVAPLIYVHHKLFLTTLGIDVLTIYP